MPFNFYERPEPDAQLTIVLSLCYNDSDQTENKPSSLYTISSASLSSPYHETRQCDAFLAAYCWCWTFVRQMVARWKKGYSLCATLPHTKLDLVKFMAVLHGFILKRLPQVFLWITHRVGSHVKPSAAGINCRGSSGDVSPHPRPSQLVH
jgi:hypothetical protein